MILAKNFARNYETKNTSNVRGLVNDCLSDPATQHIILKIVWFLLYNLYTVSLKLKQQRSEQP